MKITDLKTHYFPENAVHVITGLCPAGGYVAFCRDEDKSIRGYGDSRYAAIADMVETLEQAGEL